MKDSRLLLRKAFSLAFIAVLSLAFMFTAFPQLIPKVEACGTNTACTNTASSVGNQTCGTGGAGSCVSQSTGNIANWYEGDFVLVSGSSPAGTAEAQPSVTAGAAITWIKDISYNNFFQTDVWIGVVTGACSACGITLTLAPASPTTVTQFFVTRFRGTSNITVTSFTASPSIPAIGPPSGMYSGQTLSVPNFLAPANGFVFATITGDTNVAGNVGTGGLTALNGYNGGFSILTAANSWAYFANSQSYIGAGTKLTTCSSAPCKLDLLIIVFTDKNTAASGSQSQSQGSCPSKNTGTFTMANNTIYMYAGNALGQEIVNTVQVNVASITGSGSHTLELVIYVGTQQGISANTPSALAFQYTKTFSTGTKNQQFAVQVNLPLNTAAAAPLPFNWWAVGVIGDNKIVLNQSSLAGLQTVTGSAPPANQPLSFTALSSNVNMIALCATASYQSFFSNTITTVTTQSASSTITVTSTSVINTIGPALFSTSSNWPVIFLILLLPAGLFLGVTKNIAGALLGLMIGAIMGTMMGILPAWAFIGIVIALAAVAFIARERG